jgi:C4-dicarboxylate-specific signal transduction histidine kinase
MMSGLSQRAIQDRLERSEQALERCERIAIASQYASVVMHEVNNYLESITNLVYLTKLQTNIPDQVMVNMESIDKQLKMLATVTRRCLAYHREEQKMKDVDIAEIVQSALKLHYETIARHGVKVEIRCSGPAVASVHEGEILQVISNLLLNALDALPPADGRLSIQVMDRHPWVQIVISDNGTGIPDDLAKNLFEPFVTSKPTGTGLGLWLSKRIIAKNKGTLRFTTSQSAKKSGTSFCISLPSKIAA